nr:hypothetical protein [Streptomyces sp. NRRL S-1824]
MREAVDLLAATADDLAAATVRIRALTYAILARAVPMISRGRYRADRR